MKHKKIFLIPLSILFLELSHSLYADDLGQVIVEAEKRGPVSVTELDDEFFINEQTLSQKLSNSVMINQSRDVVNGDLISVRGNNYRATDYYDDGIPLYKTGGGYVDLSIYNANNSYITINAGGSQGLYAPSATGGEILLSSKKLKKGFHTSVLSTLSTNNVYTNLFFSNKEEKWYWKLDLNGMKQDRYKLSKDFEYTTVQPTYKRVNSDKEQLNGALKLGYNINNTSKLALKISHTKSEYGNPIQVYDEPSNSFGSSADYTRMDSKSLTSYWFYYDYQTSDVKVDFRAYYDEYSDIWNFYTSPSFASLLFDESVFNDSRLGMITSFTYSYNSQQDGSLSLNVDRNRHQQAIDNDPVKKNYENIESSLSYKHKYTVNDNMSFSASLMYKKQDLTKAYDFTAQKINYKDNEAVDAQITVNSKLGEDQSYYLSFARKNRFASLEELYPYFPWDSASTNVKPERSDNIEIGSSLKLIPDTVIDLSMYYNSINNMITYQNNSYLNVEEVKIHGIELSLSNFTFDSQYIELSFAYTKALDKDNMQILNIPKSKLLIRDSIEIYDKTKLIASCIYTGSSDDIYNDVRHKQSSYTLVDIMLSYQGTKNLEFQAGAKNLLDKYWEYKYGMPAEGRSLFVGLKYSF